MDKKQFLYKYQKITDWLVSCLVKNILCRKELYSFVKGSNLRLGKLPGEHKWKEKWSVLIPNTNLDYYRFYSLYTGENINLCPDDVMHNVITPILNPKRYISTYKDKCMFDLFLDRTFGRRITPQTIIRNIDGTCYGENYETLSKTEVEKILKTCTFDRIVIKPSVDSSSGNSIVFGVKAKDQNIFYTKEGQIVDYNYLLNIYRKNYVVQRAVNQNSFMAQFCCSSINTIRMLVYRSVVDNQPHVLNAFMRIGKEGSLVDNIHAGGTFLGINSNGQLCDFCIGTNSNKMSKFNGIDFSTQRFVIPNYENLKDFACKVSESMPHMHLFSLDVMINENNEPLLIEYNLQGFGVRGYQFTSGPALGEFTDEIINYCREHRDMATRVFISF